MGKKVVKIGLYGEICKKINKYITNNSSYTIIVVFLLVIFVILLILLITGTTTIESMTTKNKNKNNNNKGNNESIEIDGVKREYLLININPNDISNIKNVLLCFSGGGETNTEFINYTEFNHIYSPVIVFLGQLSINTYTWQNAFPWLYNNFNKNGAILNYQNDVKFVDTVLSNLFKNNIPELFLTGKSDGGGFCMLYSNISKYKLNIKAIGICSSALYGLNSSYNIGSIDINNCFIGNNNTVIPYNIILPATNISLFIIHGTGDNVMPYNGKHCIQSNYQKADVEGSLWPVIDTTVKINNNGKLTDNTYTANIPYYIKEIVDNNNLIPKYNSTNIQYSYSVYSSNNNTVLNFVTINNQNHAWAGHFNSGPNSNGPSNLIMDSTYLFLKFFNLPIDKYSPKVKSIPHTLLTYNNELMI